MSARPNILVIHADQHRADCIGAYGNADIRTPNLDALAADGVRYDRSFCTYPVCTPSRYSFLSGLYVRQHQGWTNHCTLGPGLPSFPRSLRQAGYATAAVGKMHFTPTYLDVGFDRMVLAEQDGPGRYDDDYHRWLRDEGLCDRLDLLDQVGEYRRTAPETYWKTFGALPSDLDEAHHSTTWIADRAMDVLGSWRGGGNLLMVGFIKPHHPFDPPAPWHAMYDPEGLSLLPGYTPAAVEGDMRHRKGYFDNEALTEPQLRRVMAYYYATISQIDQHVGRMLAALKEKGLYEDAMIVYTSDHGDYMGYHHMILKGNYMYDPLVRVPLIVKYPGGRGAGTASAALVSNIDVGPTILGAAGCDIPRDMAGVDLAARPEGRALVFAESLFAPEYMVRSATRKLLMVPEASGCRFFDLERDPLELENLYGEPGRAHEVAELRDALERWALYESRPPVPLDHAAPVCPGANVPPLDGVLHQAQRDYFRAKMTERTGLWSD